MVEDASAPLLVASGFVNITPPQPVPLAGYAARTEPFAGIADDLEANVVILRVEQRPLVLISFDLLYVGDLLRQRLEAALQPRVAVDDLFLAASHTHFAPATDPTLPLLGAIAPDYLALIVERVASLVNELLDHRFKPLDVALGQTTADNAVNRRCLGWRIKRRYPFLCRDVWMAPNRHGRKDETVRVAMLGADAVIWNYACHPVFIPRMNHVSADFVGVVRQALRDKMGPRTAVLFWQAFSADVYPSFATTMVGPRWRRLFSRGSDAVPLDVWQRWTERLASHVGNAIDAAFRRKVVGPIRSVRTRFPLRELLPNCATDKQVGMHMLRIGRDLQVGGISAEVAAEYSALFRAGSPSGMSFCVGCIDGVFGYLPTAQMVREGGYEAVDFLPAFSLQGRFLSDPEIVVRDRWAPFGLETPLHN